ncbi:V-type ATP synthase subunit E family protein, partial [Clostridium butyricum]
FVKEVILNTEIEGEQNLILNAEGKKVIDDAFVAEINKALDKKAVIKIDENTRDFRGGFILEKDGIEINNTFEALVSSIKDDLSLEVARVLFS